MGPYGLKCRQKVEGNPITGLLLYLEPDSQLTHYQPFQSLSICPSTVISDIVPIAYGANFLVVPPRAL